MLGIPIVSVVVPFFVSPAVWLGSYNIKLVKAREGTTMEAIGSMFSEALDPYPKP